MLIMALLLCFKINNRPYRMTQHVHSAHWIGITPEQGSLLTEQTQILFIEKDGYNED